MSTSVTVIDPWELVNRAASGDMTAFAHLYREYVGAVYRFALTRTHDRTVAEDITSETFLRALDRIHTVTYQGVDVAAWLIVITRNLFLDHIKSDRYRLETATNELDDSATDGHSPEQCAIRSDAATEVRRQVSELGTDQRQCITLRFLNDLTVTETAAIMGRNEGAVKALQYRALAQLHRLITGTNRPRTCPTETVTVPTDVTPGTRCHLPGCHRPLTQHQQNHHAICCSRRHGKQLQELRRTKRSAMVAAA